MSFILFILAMIVGALCASPITIGALFLGFFLSSARLYKERGPDDSAPVFWAAALIIGGCILGGAGSSQAALETMVLGLLFCLATLGARAAIGPWRARQRGARVASGLASLLLGIQLSLLYFPPAGVITFTQVSTSPAGTTVVVDASLLAPVAQLDLVISQNQNSQSYLDPMLIYPGARTEVFLPALDATSFCEAGVAPRACTSGAAEYHITALLRRQMGLRISIESHTGAGRALSRAYRSDAYPAVIAATAEAIPDDSGPILTQTP